MPNTRLRRCAKGHRAALFVEAAVAAVGPSRFVVRSRTFAAPGRCELRAQGCVRRKDAMKPGQVGRDVSAQAFEFWRSGAFAARPGRLRSLRSRTEMPIRLRLRVSLGAPDASTRDARSCRPGGPRLAHAVEPQHVKVDIEVERAAKALDQRHRAALRCGPFDARLIRQPARDHAMHDAQHRAYPRFLHENTRNKDRHHSKTTTKQGQASFCERAAIRREPGAEARTGKGKSLNWTHTAIRSWWNRTTHQVD